MTVQKNKKMMKFQQKWICVLACLAATEICLWHVQSHLLPASCSGKEEAVENFREYLRIPTVHPSPDYEPALDFIVKLAHSIGLHKTQVVEIVPSKGIAIITWPGSDPSLPSVLLNSHMDVVPVKKEDWKYDPFEAVMDENGDIYARGSQDTKCIGIEYLEAIRSLKQQDFVPCRTVHITFVPDEEIGGSDGFGKFIDSPEFKYLNVGIALDEGIASETDIYKLTNAERYPWWLEIKAVGRPGHGSLLYDNSAMENLMKSLEIIMKYRASQFDLVKAGMAAYWEITSVNPVYIKAGQVTPDGFVKNIQPSEAEAGFDIRLQPGADTKFLEKLIAEQWAPKSRNMSYKFVAKAENCGRTPVDNSVPWFDLLVNAVNKAGGKLADPETRHSTTDGRFMRRAGIPTFGFSPIANTPVRQHNADEFLNAHEFCNGISVYEEIIKAYSSYDSDKVRLM